MPNLGYSVHKETPSPNWGWAYTVYDIASDAILASGRCVTERNARFAAEQLIQRANQREPKK